LSFLLKYFNEGRDKLLLKIPRYKAGRHARP
jgi:hypothetical protein